MDIRQCSSSKALLVNGFHRGWLLGLKLYIKRDEWENLVQCNETSVGKRFTKGLCERRLDLPRQQI